MHRLKVSLLCLLSITLAGSVFGQTAPQPDAGGTAVYDSSSSGVSSYNSYSGGATYGGNAGAYFNARYFSGNGVGYTQGYQQYGGFVPFWMSDDVVIGPDMRLLIANTGGVGGNFGGIGRKYFAGADRILGAAGYFDVDQSANRNTYTQGTFGLETLGQYWDLRGNVYYTGNTQDKFVGNGSALCVSGTPFFSGNNIVFQGQQGQYREQAMGGADIEVGAPIFQSTPWLRGYVGAYYYKANQVQPPMSVNIPNQTNSNPVGFRGHLDAWIADDLLIGVNVTTDPVWGTNVNGMVDFRFSGFKPTRYFPQWSTRERMLAPWQRNWRIAVEQYQTATNTDVVAINPVTGKPYFVSFVNGDNPDAGTGTFEDPFKSFNHPNGIAGADIIYVARDGSTAANPYIGTMKLLDNQILLGEGGTMTPIALTASYGQCSVNGNFTLPGVDGSGNYPWVSSPGGHAIGLANNNEVSGFHIINSVDGILGTNITDANLRNLDIHNNSGRGINLTNVGGTVSYLDVNSSNNATGIFMSETGKTLTSTFTGVTTNNNTGNGLQVVGTGGSVTLTATDPTKPLIASGNGTDNANVNMTGGLFQGDFTGATFTNSVGGSGFGYSQAGGSGNLNLTNSLLNNNGIDGLNLAASAAGSISATTTGSQLNGNTRDGIHSVATGASTIVTNDSGSTMNQNGRDGYFYDLSGNSVLNATFLNDSLVSNTRSAFFGLMNASTANVNLTNVLATNSGQNGFALDATAGSIFNATTSNANFSTSGANGMSTTLHALSSANFNMTGTTDNGNVQNGVSFLADNSTYTMTALTSTFNNNSMNGVVGTAQAAGTATLDFTGSSINGNAQNGAFVTTTGLSNVNATFTNTTVDNNAAGSGVRLSMDNSPNSSLTMTGTTTLNNNGTNGLQIDATTNTVFTPNLTGTTIQGNGQDGVHINVASGSSVGTALNAGTFTNVTVTGNTGNGFDVGVTGAGSTSTLMLTNANVAGNTQSNAAVNVAQGGFLNFVTMNSDFSNSVTGAGILANVTDVNSTAYLDFDGATIDGNATVGISAVVTAPAPGVGQTGASLNVCLDDSTVSNNTLQGISIAATGAGATASFGVGQLNQNNGSTVANNGSEGVLGNAVNGGTINFREIDSHFDNNGQTVVADGLNFGANAGTIRTLFYGGSADGNSGNGVSLGPIAPNVSSFGSDLTISLANGFSGSNNGGYGLVLDGNGANSANLLQDPNTPAAVFNGNGAGSQNLNFTGVNQVVLQELGSFDNMAGDGAHFVFNNVQTAIISFNGLGTGTINNNGQNGLFVQFNNVMNGSVLVGGYTDISNNGADGVHVEFNGASAANPMNAAVEIDGVAGKTNMDSNGANAVNIQALNANLVNNFTSLPGVSLTILTPTSNDSFNACIPLPVSQAGGLAGITPNTAVNFNNLNITNSTQQGIVVAGTNTTIAAGASINNNNVSGSLGGDGISVLLNETSPRALPNAGGFTFSGNNVHDNANNGITFGVTNTGVSTVASANLTFTNNTISTNGADGININLVNPAGSTAAVNTLSFTGDTIDGNTGNGVAVNLSGVTVSGTMTNETLTNNTADGLLAILTGTGTANQTSGDFTLTGSTVTGNGINGAGFTVNNAGHLGVNLLGGTLIDSNTIDGVVIDATGINTTVTSNVTSATLTNNGTSGVGNGMTANFDNAATGNFTISNSTFGNTAAVGGTQVNGLELNVNQTTVATATNVIANISNTTFSNNEASGIAGNITGNNGGLNPTTGAEITLDTVTVNGNLGNGLAFIVDNAALLQMSVDNSLVTGNGQNGMFITADNVNTLVAIDMSDSGFNNNGTIIFPGDGFNATVNTGATLNVCAETTGTGVRPMSFSGNTGDGFDVQVNDPGSRSDIDFHSVIAGASAADGLLGNSLNGVIAQSFDGGDVNLRAYTTHFDGNGGAGLFGAATNTISDPSTIARYRIIGGTANGNTGDGFKFVATNTMGAPTGGTELTAQFQADDFGTGISAQNNGGYGLEYTTSTPGGGINANLLMTGGSQLLNNGAGTLNVNMGGADQVIIGLSGTFDGSTTGDGIHIDLQNITGLALVSLQGPGEVRNNAGDGIDVSMTNVAQGGVFIGGFSDVSNNGTGNNALIGQDGIKINMNNVGLGAITIDSQTATLPANIMNVSNNTGNGVNVMVNNGSVINNTAFNAILGAKLVNVIDYTAPDAPCPTPLPNPLLTIVPVNASTALGITFQPNLAIQNLNVDNNGNATGGNLSGDGIVVTVDTAAKVLAPLGTAPISINNNIVTNTGSTSATGTHDGIVLQLLGNADVANALITTNDIENNNGNGINVIANGAATLTSLDITKNTILNQTGTLGVTGNGIVLNLPNAAVLATANIDGNDVEGNNGDGFQMVNPATGVDLTVNFLHNQFIGNGSIVPPSATTTYPPGGMGIDIVLNNQNAIRNTINILSDATGVNTISDSASFGVFLQATNQALYNLNVTGTGGKNIINHNTDAGIAVVGGSFVNPNNSLNPNKFSVGNVLIDNVDVTNTVAGSHPSLPNFPFSGDGIGILLQQYAEMNSFVVGSAAARNTTLANNAGDGLRINAIEQSQFRQTLADNVTPVTPLGQATILLQQIDATNNGRNGIDIIRRDNALLSWDDATVNPGAALFSVFNPVSWQAITDGGSFIHINDVIATSNGINGLNVSTTNAQFPITRIDIVDTAPVAMGYNPKVVGHSQYDLNTGRGIQFTASADSILVVNARDTSASDNLQGGILVQTFNRATFGDVLTATPLGDPTSDNSIRSTFNGMLISGNGRSNANANAPGFEVQANGGTDPGNVSSSSVVNISMTGTATNARNLFDSNGGDDFRVTANRFSENYFNLNRIDMRDTAFVQLGSDGLHVQTNESSFTQVDLTNASIGYPTASSTQTGLSGDGIDIQTTGSSAMIMNVGNTLALNRFGDGIAPGAADPTNAPDVSIYGNRLNGIVVRNQGNSDFVGSVFDTASRFNGNRGYSAEMQDGTGGNFYAHSIDHSLFSDNSFEGIAVIANSRSQSGLFVDVASLATTQPAFGNTYLLYNFLNQATVLNSSFALTNSTVSNNGGATPYVNSINNVNGLEIDVSTRSYVAADIRNNIFHGNTLDDVATASFQASTGGFNANGTISTVGLLNTPGSIDEVVAGVDRIFLEDTAQLDMRFMQNVGDQIHISSAGSNNPNMNANGAHRTDPNTKFNPSSPNQQQTSLFQVNAFHYDTVATVTSNNVFTGANVQGLDTNPVATVQDTPNFPGSITQPGNVIAARNLEAAILNIANIYTNTNAAPTNAFPTAFTQVRVDDITTGVNGTGANGVIGYTAGGQFTLAGAGSPGIAVNDVFRVHLLDTNTFNQAGVAQNVEQAFSSGFASHLIRSTPGQLAGNAGTFIPTNPLAPYFQWPSSSFPPF